VADPGGGDWGDRLLLKPNKVTLFTMILYNSENNIHHIKPFCCSLFCHSSFVKYTSCLSCSGEAVMRLDYQILLKSPSLNLLAGSAPVGTSAPRFHDVSL